MLNESSNENIPLSNADPKPEITWWMVLMSVAFISVIALIWWYFLPEAYGQLVNDFLRPMVNSGPMVTVESFILAFPLMVFGLLAMLAMSVLILVARPLSLTQRRANELFKPFLWLGFVGVIFGVLSQPLALGVSTYLENAGYYQCTEHTRISPFTSTRIFVLDPELCNQI